MYIIIILGLSNFVNASLPCGKQVQARPERIALKQMRVDATSSRDRIFDPVANPTNGPPAPRPPGPPYLKTLGQDFGDAVRSKHVTPQSAPDLDLGLSNRYILVAWVKQ